MRYGFPRWHDINTIIEKIIFQLQTYLVLKKIFPFTFVSFVGQFLY